MLKEKALLEMPICLVPNTNSTMPWLQAVWLLQLAQHWPERRHNGPLPPYELYTPIGMILQKVLDHCRNYVYKWHTHVAHTLSLLACCILGWGDWYYYTCEWQLLYYSLPMVEHLYSLMYMYYIAQFHRSYYFVMYAYGYSVAFFFTKSYNKALA